MRSWLGEDDDIGRLQNESELTATLMLPFNLHRIKTNL
jgi:hypothetical protein